MRLIPIAIDIVIFATFVASVLRVGRLEVRLDKIDNFVIRWLILQLVFLGNTVLDTCVNMAAQSSYFVSSIKKEDEDRYSKNLASSAISGIASAFGLGVKEDREERRWRDSPSPKPYDTATSQGLQPNGLQKKRSSSQNR
ncbi:hypothetical protein BC830DRAFT_1118442 [Chytriomyces sp. MP71]|nr:hypothetical protein BC830DRAFT_1118442 [Chytriomyces sp. MP71]